jgi:hypothetical protein
MIRMAEDDRTVADLVHATDICAVFALSKQLNCTDRE